MPRPRMFRGLSVVFALAALVGTALLTGRPAQATFPGTDGRIAFWDFMTGQIYTVNPDGTGLVQLTNVAEGQTAAHPGWSPDGKQIAFDSDMSGQIRMWIMDADGGHLHKLATDSPGYADFFPRFTPDGQRVVFTRCKPDGGCAIYSVRTDGTTRRAITPFQDEVFDFAAEVSPDGTQLAFERFGANGIIEQVYVMNADGSGARPLTAPELEGFSPSWSPDARYITFSSNCCRLGSNIYVMKANGSGTHRLTATPLPNNDITSAHSPGGDRIVFVSDRRYDDLCCLDLFGMRANGTRETMINTGHFGILDPEWGSAPLLHATSAPRAPSTRVPPSSIGLRPAGSAWCRSIPAPVRASQHCQGGEGIQPDRTRGLWAFKNGGKS